MLEITIFKTDSEIGAYYRLILNSNLRTNENVWIIKNIDIEHMSKDRFWENVFVLEDVASRDKNKCAFLIIKESEARKLGL